MKVTYAPFHKLKVGDEFRRVDGALCMRVAPYCEHQELGSVNAHVAKAGNPFDRSAICNSVMLEDKDDWKKGAMGRMDLDEAVIVTQELYAERVL